MKRQNRLLLDKARHALHAAEVLIRAQEAESAAGRTYYAMFYTASAILAEVGLGSTKHSGVHALFGEHFAKLGRIDPKFHRFLLDDFDRRLQADYNFEAVITTEETISMVEKAHEFLTYAELMSASDMEHFPPTNERS